jgi:ABC-type antimicrobial peptide transport system permease subunit
MSIALRFTATIVKRASFPSGVASLLPTELVTQLCEIFARVSPQAAANFLVKQAKRKRESKTMKKVQRHVSYFSLPLFVTNICYLYHTLLNFLTNSKLIVPNSNQDLNKPNPVADHQRFYSFYDKTF